MRALTFTRLAFSSAVALGKAPVEPSRASLAASGRIARKPVARFWSWKYSLKPFLTRLRGKSLILASTESTSAPVTQPIYPNLILHSLGLLDRKPSPGGGLDIDTHESAALALVDHQICHIDVNDTSGVTTIASTFTSEEEGVDTVAGRTPLPATQLVLTLLALLVKRTEILRI